MLLNHYYFDAYVCLIAILIPYRDGALPYRDSYYINKWERLIFMMEIPNTLSLKWEDTILILNPHPKPQTSPHHHQTAHQ